MRKIQIKNPNIKSTTNMKHYAFRFSTLDPDDVNIYDVIDAKDTVDAYMKVQEILDKVNEKVQGGEKRFTIASIEIYRDNVQ